MIDNNEIITNLISRYLVGDITDSERVYLENWVQESADNRTFFERITSADYVKYKIERNKSQDYNRALEEFLERKNKKSERRIAMFMLGVGGVAAVLAIIFFISTKDMQEPATIPNKNVKMSLIYPTLKLSNGDVVTLEAKETINDADAIIAVNGLSIDYSKTGCANDEELKYNELTVPDKCVCPLTLPDGSKVWVNASSSIKFPVTFSRNNRVVYVTGEVFFDVVKDRERPFKVITGVVEVNVLGTSFNVSNYNEQHSVEITLVEGRLSTLSDSVDYEIKPNEQLVINKSNKKVKINKVVAFDYAQWMNGLYIFNKKRVNDIIQIIKRQWGITCILSNPEDGEMCITGVMNINDGLDSFIKLLSRSSDFDCRIDGDTVTIK